MMKSTGSLLLPALLLVLPLQALSATTAETPEKYTARPSAEAMLLDGLIYRPIALASTVIGTGIFIVTLPFSAAGGNVKDAGERLVVEPAREVFGRCLGCFPDASYE